MWTLLAGAALAQGQTIESIRWIEGVYTSVEPDFRPGVDGKFTGARTSMNHQILHAGRTPLPTLMGLHMELHSPTIPGQLLYRIREEPDSLVLEVWSPGNADSTPVQLTASVVTASLLVFSGDPERFPSRVEWAKTPSGLRTRYQGPFHGTPIDVKWSFVPAAPPPWAKTVPPAKPDAPTSPPKE